MTILPMLNYAICALGALFIIFCSITSKINTKHPATMFFLALVGMVFIVGVVASAANETIVASSVLCRFFMLIAMIAWFIDHSIINNIIKAKRGAV